MKLKVKLLTPDRAECLSARYQRVLRLLHGEVIDAKISTTNPGYGLVVDIDINFYREDEDVIICNEDIEKVYSDNRLGVSYCNNCGRTFDTVPDLHCSHCSIDNYIKEFIPGSKKCVDMDDMIDNLFTETYSI